MAEAAQDRWRGDTRLKRIFLKVNGHEFVLEGDNLGLTIETFTLIDIWVKAIIPEASQQAAIDALATTVGTKAADLQAVVDANTGK